MAARTKGSRPGAGTRERMVRTMGRLLRRQGYAATGLQQLAAEAEAPMGSMYFHFPGGKEQLAAEAVARAGGDLGEMLASLLGGASVAGAVRAIAAAMGRDLEGSRWHHGCPIATTALEMAGESERIRGAANAVFDQWELLFVQRLCADGVAAERARAIASTIVAGLEGALLLARTRRSLAPLDEIGELLASWIAAETSGEGPSPSPDPPSPARPRKESR